MPYDCECCQHHNQAWVSLCERIVMRLGSIIPRPEPEMGSALGYA